MSAIDVTQHVCPANKYGDTHHLIEKSAGNGERVQVCEYCGKGVAQLRHEIERQH